MTKEIELGSFRINNATKQDFDSIKVSIESLTKKINRFTRRGSRKNPLIVDALQLISNLSEDATSNLDTLGGTFKDVTKFSERLQVAVKNLQDRTKRGLIKFRPGEMADFVKETEKFVKNLTKATGVEQDLDKKRKARGKERLANLRRLHKAQVKLTKAMLRQRERNARRETAELKRRHRAQVKLTKAFLRTRAKLQKDADKKLLKQQRDRAKKRQEQMDKFFRRALGLVRFGNKMLFTTRIVIAPFINGMLKAGRAISQVGDFAIRSSIKFEAFELQLRALNKSAINTAQEFEKIKEFAAESPLSTDEVVESFIRLKAVGVKQAFETTKTLGQIGLVFNRDLRDVTSSFISLEARTLRRLGIVINRSTSKAILESGNLIRVVDNNVNSIRDAILDIFQKKAPQAFKIFTSSVQAQLKVLLSFMEIFGADLGDKLFRKPLARALVAINAFVRNNSQILVGAISQLVNQTDRFESNIRTLGIKLRKFLKETVAGRELKKDILDNLGKVIESITNIFSRLFLQVARSLSGALVSGVELASSEIYSRGGLLKMLFGEGEKFDLKTLGVERDEIQKTFNRIRELQIRGAKQGVRLEIPEDKGLFSSLKDFADLLNAFDDPLGLTRKAANKFLKNNQAEFNKLLETFTKQTEKIVTKQDRARLVALLDQQRAIENVLADASANMIDTAAFTAKELGKLYGAAKDTITTISEATTDETRKALEIAFLDSAFKKARKALELIQKLKLDAKEKGIKLSEIIIQDEAKVINEAVISLKKQLKLSQEKLKTDEKVLEINRKTRELFKEKIKIKADTRATLAEQQLIPVLEEQINKLKQQIPEGFKKLGEATRDQLQRDILKLQELLKKLTAGELSEATKEDTPQERASKILKEIGDAFFIGRSLGSQILDEAFLTDNKFKNKIEQFFISAAEQFDVGKAATTQKGLRELFNLMLREDQEAAEEVFKRLSASAFEDVASSGVLSRLQKSSGFLTKILRDRLKEIGDAAGSAKGRLLEMLSTTAGQNKLAKDLLNSTELLKQTNEELAKAGGFFDSLGKKTALFLRQQGSEKAFLDFAKRISKVKNLADQEVAGSIMGMQDRGSIAITQVIDQKKLRDVLSNAEKFLTDFVNSIEGKKAKLDIITKAVEETTFVPSVKKALRQDLEAATGEDIITNLSDKIDEFRKVKLRDLEQGRSGVFIGFERFFTKLKTDATTTAQAVQTALSGIANSIGNNLTNALVALAQGTATVEEAFQNMAQTIIQDLIRLSIQFLLTAAAAAVLNAFTGGAASGVSGVASAISGGASPDGLSATRPLFEGLQFAKGGVMKGKMGPVHKYAQGGIARSPQVAIFGEGSGAEAFVPLPDGRSIPVSMSGGRGGGTQNVNVSFNVSAIDQGGVAKFLVENQRDITLTVINAINSNRSFRSAI